MPDHYSIHLPTGTLQLNMQPGRIPLPRLLGFAARISSKRKFLLVSKILGKHYPVSPKLMSWSYRALARTILAHQPGRAVWIGMAETATGLGYGVFAAAYQEGLENSLFIQTTRYCLSGLDRLEFIEAHSHATDLFLYYPLLPAPRQHFLSADTLVLIDDEISTGHTFLRLIKAYQIVNPGLRKVFIVSLVNFADTDNQSALEQQAGVTVIWISLRKGTLHFEDAGQTAIDSISVNVSGNGLCKRHLTGWPGRLGIFEPIRLNPGIVDELLTHFTRHDQRPILVLGTGECNAPAYLLGRELECRGFAVKVQSTTRSPIYLSNDIKTVLEFIDNYEDDIPNFIYNLTPEAYREIVICHETPVNAAISRLLEQWQAISARFEIAQDSVDATVSFCRS